MVNAKRLYVYGVLGAALVLLLWGLTSILEWAGRALAAALGSRDVVGADVALDELSLAIALVVVALPIWLVHFWLAQQPLGRAPDVAAEERASPARATYFFLVLTIAGGMALLQLYDSVQDVLRLALTDERAWGLAGAVAGLIVFGAAWLGHLWWRRADLLAAPARTAGDWLTRAYLYSALFILAILLAFWIGSAAAVLLGELVDARAMWESWESWEVAFVGPAAGVVGAAFGWSAQWLIGQRLLRADPPLGPAHRASRTRTGYFLAVVLVCATAVLFLLSSSAGQVLAEWLGVWRSEVGSRWIEDVALPLTMVVPFVVVGWWHWRQAMREALAFGGQQRHENVRRSGLYGLAFVGLAGLSIGAAWTIQAMLEYAAAAREIGSIRSAARRSRACPCHLPCQPAAVASGMEAGTARLRHGPRFDRRGRATEGVPAARLWSRRRRPDGLLGAHRLPGHAAAPWGRCRRKRLVARGRGHRCGRRACLPPLAPPPRRWARGRAAGDGRACR